MTADTYSTGIGIVLQGTGNNNNNWGALLDAGLQVADDAICGRLDSTVTGGTLDLSGTPPPAGPSQARYAYLLFVGVLTSNQTVIVPNLSKIWLIQNSTSGAFSLFVKTTSGVATQIPQGSTKFVVCYPPGNAGAGTVFRQDSLEIGEVKDFALATVPGGYLECDGSAISRTNYPDLYAKIGTTWGVGDNVTTYNLPNLKDTGRFRRSRTGSVAVGTYQANANLSHTHTGTASGTTGNDSPDHAHTYSGTTGNDSPDHAHVISTAPMYVGNSTTNVQSGAVAVPNATNIQNTTTAGADTRHAHGYSGTSAGANARHAHSITNITVTNVANGGTEARPEAAVVLSCIRY